MAADAKQARAPPGCCQQGPGARRLSTLLVGVESEDDVVGARRCRRWPVHDDRRVAPGIGFSSKRLRALLWRAQVLGFGLGDLFFRLLASAASAAASCQPLPAGFGGV